MPLSFKYPITKADGSEFKSAKELLGQLSGESAGFYLLSTNAFWHGGLHISDDTSGYLAEKHPVRSMATGEVVAYRLNDDYCTSTWGEGTDAQTLKYSTSFCLVRHVYASPHKRQAATASATTTAGAAQGPQNTLVFYSLYMHLQPYAGYAQRVMVQGASALAYPQFPDIGNAIPTFSAAQGASVETSAASKATLLGLQPVAGPIPVLTGTELLVLDEAQWISGNQITRLLYVVVSAVPALGEEAPVAQDNPFGAAAVTVGQRYWIAINGAQLGSVNGVAIRKRPAYWKSSRKAVGTLLRPLGALRDPVGEEAGPAIHGLPTGSKIEIQRERLLKQGGKKKLFAQGKVLSIGAGDPGSIALGDAVWISSADGDIAREPVIPDSFNSVVICDPPVPIEAGATIGYLGLYEIPGASDEGKISRQQVHVEIFTGDPKFDDFFANAAGLTEGKKYKMAGTDGAPARASTSGGVNTFTPGTDPLLLPVVVETTASLAKEDSLHKKWFPVEGIGDSGVLNGWVPESRLKEVVQYDWEKLGFRKIEESNENADGYMDPEKMPEFFKSIYKLIHKSTGGDVTSDELIAANHSPAVRNALARVVARHPSEWQGKGDAAKWNVIKENEALLKNDPIRLKHELARIDALSWWDEIKGVKDFPVSPNVWHFNPAMFVEKLAETDCECGCCLGKIFVKHKWVRKRRNKDDITYFGPYYAGTLKLDRFSGWDDLIETSKSTEDEKAIVIAMSSNEGAMDAVQAWDWQTFSAGAMQKTVDPEGYGELPQQIYEFKVDNPDLFAELFERCGWSIEKEINKTRIYYSSDETDGIKITGIQLYEFIKRGFGEHDLSTPRESKPLASIAHAVLNKEYQKKQVTDFIKRMREAISTRPTGFRNPASEYFRSRLGRALVLDQSVNAPANLARSLEASIRTLTSRHAGLSEDPSQWGANRELYESELIQIYGPSRIMNSAAARYRTLSNLL